MLAIKAGVTTSVGRSGDEKNSSPVVEILASVAEIARSGELNILE
jgi:hypothetical protein